VSEVVTANLIAALPPTLVALIAVWQAVKAKQKADKTDTKTENAIQEIHIAVNSRMEEMLQLTRREAALQATDVERVRGEGVASDLAAKQDANRSDTDTIHRIQIVGEGE
jgi:choline-glycine betaine transporter